MKRSVILLFLSIFGNAQCTFGQESLNKTPAEAKEFKGHYYMLYTDATKWETANFKCMKRGGHLVVINDAEENDFVHELTKQRPAVWIGLSRSMGTWKWVALSSQSEFFNWAPGEPNIDRNAKNLKSGVGVNVCMRNDNPNVSLQGMWDDCFGDDNGVTGYVCEWDKKK